MSRPCLLPLSGANADALAALAGSYICALDPNTCGVELEDVCYTAGARRDHHRYRAAVVGCSREELVERLGAVACSRTRATHCLHRPSLAFTFPGIAAPKAEMLLELLGDELCFLEAMQSTDRALQALALEPLLEQMVDPARAVTGNERRALGAFAIELSLAELWRSWGLRPATSVGHGPGHYAAQVFSGSVSLEDGLSELIANPCASGGEGSADGTDAVLEMALPQHGSGAARKRLLSVLGELYVQGFEPAWESLVGAGARCVTVPKYPWQRESLWPAAVSGGRVWHVPDDERVRVAHEPDVRVRARAAFISLAARILRIPVQRISPSETLAAHGLDSLMAMEIATAASAQLQVQLPLERIAGTPLSQLADEVAALAGNVVAEPPISVIGGEEAARFEPFALSEIQQAYWIGRHSGIELGGVSTHVYMELKGPALELQRLSLAIDRLVVRHDMLRAVIDADGVQRVLPAVPEYELAVSELAALDASERERTLVMTRRELSHQVRATEQWPLFEIRVSRLGRVDRLHLSFDMLIADAASLLLLARELAALYEDPRVVLPELGLTFRDYLQAERSSAAAETIEGSRSYWRSRVPTLPPAPELPLARSPAEIGAPHFKRLQGSLEPTLWGALKARASDAGLTPSALLCAAYAEVLGRFARSPRFTLNLTNSHRLPLHPDVNAIVGDFTSLGLLEINVGASASFEERARTLQAQLWSDLEHRAVNCVSLLRELPAAGRASAAALPIVYTSVLNHTEGASCHPLDVFGREVYAISQTPQVYLDHQVMERHGALLSSWDSVEGLFPQGLIEEMLAAFQRLLRRLATDAGSWSERAPLRLSSVQHRLRARVNATYAPRAEELLQAPFLRCASAFPERIALACGERRISYQELARMSRSLGAELFRRGARPDSLVAIALEKGVEQVVAALAVLESGAAYLPVDPELPRDRRNWLLEHGEVELVLTDSDAAGRLDLPVGVDSVCVDRHQPIDVPASLPRAMAENLAYVIFTSGSTGVPKGVMVEHRSALNTVLDVNSRFLVTSNDRVLALSALSFDLSVWDIFGALAAGATIVMPEPGRLRDPAYWAELVAAGVTVWNSVPALMKLFIEHLENHGESMSARLRLALLSGDWIPVALPARVRAAFDGIEIVSLGGATEASIWSIHHRVGADDSSWDSIPYGLPLSNQSLHVLDQALDDRPDWVAGELYIGGAGLARGYWKDPERTAAAFVHHPRSGQRLYRCGDIGRYRPNGEIEFLGREDGQVKVQGYRIELGEIEAAIEAHPQVAAAVACARGETSGEKRLVAHYVPVTGAKLNRAELRSFLAMRLPAHMVPVALGPIERIPLSSNGKVDRGALPDPVRSAPAGRDIDGPMAALVGELLGLERLDPDAHLLEQGVSSLEIVRLADALERRLGVRPELELLFRARSAAELIQELEELSSSPESAPC